MSSRIDWGEVAKEIVKAFATETARGAYYAFFSQVLFPYVKNMLKQGKSDREILEEVKRLLETRQQQLLPPEYMTRLQTQTAQILSREVAQPPSRYPPQPSTSQPVATYPSTRSRFEIELLENEIRRLEQIRLDVMDKYYKGEMSEEEYRRKVSELERTINDKKYRLAQLEQVRY